MKSSIIDSKGFVMKFRVVAFLALVVSFMCSAADLPRSTPEEQGVSSKSVLAFVEAADKIEYMHSFVLLRHGHIIAEGWWTPYDAQTPHVMWSLSKSFTSTAVGLAISEGKLSLDDEVLKFFPDDAPAEPSANLKMMRVRDLMRMLTGHQTEPKRKLDEAWVKTFLNHPVNFKPGTHFLYNSMGTYMQSAIVQKVAGMTVADYLKPRLFEPLDISTPVWEASPQGISAGGWGLFLRTEDIAKFGQLYLQKGQWNGKQLVPAEWVAQATALQTSNGSNPKSDWDQGYGFQFWRCRHNAFRGDGAFGQYCVVMPDQDAVLVVTSGIKNMQAPLDLVWDTLLPAMTSAPLPTDTEAASKLAELTKHLSLHTQEGTAEPAKVFGKKYAFPANERKLESITLEGDGKAGPVTLVAKIDGVEQRVLCGKGSWQKGRTGWGLLLKEQSVAASGAWTEEDTFKAKISFYQSHLMLTVTLTFAGNDVKYRTEANVSFGPSKEPPITWTAK
jgi:CubicO group peptidase (beta-lactamase class C family)